jgi:antitoxin (DNA-binding transcriptional repressor) of toxin-antitoxin stability system
MQAINIQEAETRLKALIDAAQAGEDVYISNGEAGIVQLVPCQAPTATQTGAPRRPGRLRGKIRISDEFDAADDAIADLFEDGA